MYIFGMRFTLHRHGLIIKLMFTSIKTWTKNHRNVLLIVLTVLLLAFSAFYLLRPLTPDAESRLGRESTTQPEQALTKPAPLTGIEVEPALATRPVIGVMIENSPDARPQSSLNSADIVFEAVTEGGITRFLALYQQNTPGKIGPVRSVRVPFVDWFMGFDASIAHVGGAPQALQLINRRNAKDLDQFKHSAPYYRAGDRHAPHNMYTSMKALRNLQKQLGHKESKFKEIPRSNDSPAENPSANRITLNYSSSSYQAQFRYQKRSNSYQRYLAGAPHVDRETSSAITVKNVVAIVMPTYQEGQYAMMHTIGKGKAIVFKDGSAKNVTWRQTGPRKRIELVDGDGKEVPLNRGSTWFAVVPKGKPIDF